MRQVWRARWNFLYVWDLTLTGGDSKVELDGVFRAVDENSGFVECRTLELRLR